MEGNNITININTGTIVKAILLVLLFFSIYLFRDLVVVVLTSVVVASAIEPAVRWFKKHRVPRTLSVILVYLLLATILVSLFYSFIPPLFKEISNFVTNLPQFVDNLDFWSPIKDRDLGILNPAVQDFSSNVSIREFAGQFQKIVGNATEGFWKTISTVFGGALSFMLIIILSFYLSVQENGIDNFLKVVTPAKHQDYIVSLWKRSQAKIGLWMQGQLVLALIIGILVYLGLAILDIRYAFLLAVLAGIFELIPLFGPILAAIPAIFLGFAQGGPSTGLIVIGLYLIIQQFENHLIFPLVVKKVTGLPAIFVIISLIIGAKLAGFLGIILSVPIATAIMEFVNDVEAGNRKILEEQATKEAK
jgi:predicted PurR-regulated permease PerM